MGDEFFAALDDEKLHPRGRENLSPHWENVLLDAEASLDGAMEEAEQLSQRVQTLAEDILRENFDGQGEKSVELLKADKDFAEKAMIKSSEDRKEKFAESVTSDKEKILDGKKSQYYKTNLADDDFSVKYWNKKTTDSRSEVFTTSSDENLLDKSNTSEKSNVTEILPKKCFRCGKIIDKSTKNKNSSFCICDVDENEELQNTPVSFGSDQGENKKIDVGEVIKRLSRGPEIDKLERFNSEVGSYNIGFPDAEKKFTGKQANSQNGNLARKSIFNHFAKSGKKGLKIHNAVCECPPEKKIVKRQERKSSQNKLKRLDKRAHSRSASIAKADQSSKTWNPVNEDTILQTPLETPTVSEDKLENSPANLMKIDEGKFRRRDRAHSKRQLEVEKMLRKKGEIVQVKNERDGDGESQTLDKRKKESLKRTVLPDKEPRQLEKFLERERERLLDLVKIELENMKDDFISTKLPNFWEFPQLVYWIDLRTKGNKFSNSYKKKLMKETTLKWEKIKAKRKPVPEIESLKVPKKLKKHLNFNKANFWKRKIRKIKENYLVKVRKEVVNNYTRVSWSTMENGTFPNENFKKTFFTYLPPTEKDVYPFGHYCK